MEKYSVTSEEIEGGHLNQGFNKWVHNINVLPVSHSKSKLVLTTEYEYSDSKAAGNSKILETTKEGLIQLFKGFEGYLKSPEVAMHKKENSVAEFIAQHDVGLMFMVSVLAIKAGKVISVLLSLSISFDKSEP
ncbi:hypothetical protein R1sor_025211 [Riccia sorocarpa]|uniref:Uncharacterized protein n=1 Tax=Riccia sorocarpa TaxID=122646 RepID=A0ABD3G8G6_9MARC